MLSSSRHRHRHSYIILFSCPLIPLATPLLPPLLRLYHKELSTVSNRNDDLTLQIFTFFDTGHPWGWMLNLLVDMIL